MKNGNTKFMVKIGNTLSNLLDLNIDKKTLRVKNRESEHREFKRGFDNKQISKYAKTMAAFANRDGGVIFFGIKDRPKEIVGIDENKIPDDVVITNFLKEYFQPEILFYSETPEYLDNKVYAIVVKPSQKKPVICKKAKTIKVDHGSPEKEVLREGAIYYRYSSSSDEIKYGELRYILDVERESLFRSMVDNITLLNKVGYDKAAIVDAEELRGDDQAASVYLTNETAKNLNWIDSGKFVEDATEGDKAFYVVRNVEIRHGVEIAKPTDFAQTHPLTKTALMKEVKISGGDFDAVTWKLGIKDNPVYHISSFHGKNKIHKYTEGSKEKILSAFPLDIKQSDRKSKIIEIGNEYKNAKR